MYEIQFYENRNGKSEVREWYERVGAERNQSKLAKQRYDKVKYYIGTLEDYGTRAGEPFVKHFQGKLWELRPANDRIIFFVEKGNEIILLHQFVKKTRTTPKREIKKAQSRLKDWQRRNNRRKKR